MDERQPKAFRVRVIADIVVWSTDEAAAKSTGQDLAYSLGSIDAGPSQRVWAERSRATSVAAAPDILPAEYFTEEQIDEWRQDTAPETVKCPWCGDRLVPGVERCRRHLMESHGFLGQIARQYARQMNGINPKGKKFGRVAPLQRVD